MSWGECPSIYPLPPLYPGTTAAVTDTLPTHVHKRSRQTHNCSGDCSGDVVQLGHWVDGKPSAAFGAAATGWWAPTPGVPNDSTVIDVGNRYASKDFEDTKNMGVFSGGRRINYGERVIVDYKFLARALRCVMVSVLQVGFTFLVVSSKYRESRPTIPSSGS